jgi:hypothetical protein
MPPVEIVALPEEVAVVVDTAEMPQIAGLMARVLGPLKAVDLVEIAPMLEATVKAPELVVPPKGHGVALLMVVVVAQVAVAALLPPAIHLLVVVVEAAEAVVVVVF